MGSLRIRYASRTPELKHLVETRSYFDRSVATLRKIAMAGDVALEIPIFSGDWSDNRKKLPLLMKFITSPVPVLEVRETRPDGSESHPLTPEYFANRVKMLREIEIETQMLTDLEEGFIDSRDEFKPHDENWNEPSAK